MEKLRQYLTFCLFGLGMLFSTGLAGQDAHFTLYNQTPLIFNPAQTGGFYGSYRIAGIYRDQYRSVFSNAYKSLSFSADVPIIRGFREQDWVGVGVMFFMDRSGTVAQTWQSIKLSGAYHLGLGRNNQSTLSIGFQTGGTSKRYRNLTADAFNDPREYAAFLQENPDGPESSYTDYAGGLKFTSRYNETDNFHIGVAVNRIGRTDFSVIKGQQDSSVIGPVQRSSSYRLDPKAVVQAGISFLASDRLRVSPSLQAQFIFGLPELEIEAQAEGQYLLNAEKKTSLIVGAGARYGGPLDAVSLMAGLQKDALKVVLAYDINVSGLTKASAGFGGLEISAIYIGKIYKRPNPDPVIFCPRL